MAEFNIRTDSVDVEQIMRQIRARIKEKRGVDYTEQQIQELANVKLQRFLDPKGVRSDLVEQFKRTRGTSEEPPNYGFEDTTLYETHRGIVRLIRKLLNPILKMFFNPNPIVHVLHLQGQINNINAQQFRVREELDALYYEVIHNLVLEVTRLGIESKNLKMRLESLSSRMDFDERRARALEGVVAYKQGTGPAKEAAAFAKGSPVPASAPEVSPPARAFGTASQTRPGHEARPPNDQAPMAQAPMASTGSLPPTPASAAPAQQTGEGAGGPTTGTARRRRRRRRGRRGGRGRGTGDTASAPNGLAAPGEGAAATPPHGDPIGGPGAADSVTPRAEGSAPHEPQRDFSEADGDDSDADGGSEPSDRDPHRGSRDGDPEQ
jgi:hypothetical protein